MKQSIRTMALAIAMASSIAVAVSAQETPSENRYTQTNFVANKTSYHPTVATEPAFINAWGIAIRPQGAGGHFWITAKDVSYQYIGDVSQSADASLRPLHAKDVKYVQLPVGGGDHFATSVVFSDSKENFTITQTIAGVDPVTAPAKFLFASDGGIISAWTERKKADGTFDRATSANPVIDQSKDGVQFFGLALSAAYDHIYAANFGRHADMRVFDGAFKPLALTFDTPFDDNHNGRVDAGEYAPFNVQALTTPEGEHHLFVAYAKTQPCNREGLKKHACKKGELYAGEEDTSKPGQGRLAEFTEDGKLVAVWNDGGKLSAPWGMAYAPKNFGALSGMLLVANFGSGTIAAFDPATHHFVDTLRDANGKPVAIHKIWGILFGNGESLGDANTLYFTAGPRDEHDGIFGSLRVAQ